ncbi:hypothetical protein SDC9_82631 [bioreactor metagenome]|uniref:Uncharacterized protein n=1 Tax=bioreactor metagenome TaxID=1076179 RepID=A0A644Z596_9ZZZZ
MQLGGHVRDFKRNGLLKPDGLSKLDPFLGVTDRLLKGPLGDAQRLRGNADAPAVQRCHGNFKTLAFLAQQVFFRYLHVVKDQFGGGGGTDSHLVVVVAKFKALPALFHNERGDAPGSDVGRGHGKNHIGVRLRRVGDKDLTPVQEIVIALVHGGSLGAARVGARVWLGQAKCAQLLPPAQRNQVLLFLLLRAKGENRPGSQRSMG